MFDSLSGWTRKLQFKIHCLALGTTLGLGATFLNQGCITTGQ